MNAVMKELLMLSHDLPSLQTKAALIPAYSSELNTGGNDDIYQTVRSCILL